MVYDFDFAIYKTKEFSTIPKMFSSQTGQIVSPLKASRAASLRSNEFKQFSRRKIFKNYLNNLLRIAPQDSFLVLNLLFFAQKWNKNGYQLLNVCAL